MKDLVRLSPKAHTYAHWSLWSLSITVVFATVHHFYEMKTVHVFFLIPVLISLLLVLRLWFSRTGNSAVIWIYGLLNGLIILGPGLMDGFRNHALKLFIYYLHNGFIPPLLAGLFSDTRIGDPLWEGTGILTFIASLFTAYFGYKVLQERRMAKAIERD